VLARFSAGIKIEAYHKKTMKALSFLVAAAFCLSCSPQKQTTTSNLKSTNNSFAKDSIEYYETEFEVRQRNYLNQLQAATWNVISMQRQAKLDLENLNNYSLVFNRDMSFRLTTVCNAITGTYEIKGTGIKFNNIVSANTASCANQNQEDELVRLLRERVSAYTVDGKTLLLRDNATNVVFRANY
jgi:heat shock protein HslJ